MAQITVQTRLFKQKFEEMGDSIKALQVEFEDDNNTGKLAAMQNQLKSILECPVVKDF